MKKGDFTSLSKDYIYRTGYSHDVLKQLYAQANLDPKSATIADVGAGTGKLTQDLIKLGFKGVAVEPNDAMRAEGIRLLGNTPFRWLKGSGEQTTLPDQSIDWVLMGSSFHWTDQKKALKEFSRILKPGGHFVALWNPRDLEVDSLHTEIEQWIYSKKPHLKRVSSGGAKYTEHLNKTLVEAGLFKDVTFVEDAYNITMQPEHYIGIWRSVNDIRVELGQELFKEFLGYIESKVMSKKTISVPYKTRAWMARALKN